MSLINRRIALGAAAIIIGLLVAIFIWIGVDLAYSSNVGFKYAKNFLDSDRPVGKSYEYGWYGLRSGYDGKYGWGGREFDVFTDRYGYRVGSRDAITRDIENLGEVIFLGDSFTFGGSTSWSESYVGMFENQTKRIIINAGVYSYSPSAYLYQYQNALKSNILKPSHTVIIALDISDIQDEASFRADGIGHPISTEFLVNGAPPQPNLVESLIQWMVNLKNNHLLLTNKIFRMLFPPEQSFPAPKSKDSVYNMPRSAFTWYPWNELDKREVLIKGEVGLGYSPLGVRGGLLRAKSKVTEIIHLANKTNSAVYILIYPWPAQLKYLDTFSWSKFVEEICLENHCAGVIDTIPIFRALARDNPEWYAKYYFSGDIHFNQEGNKILTEAILKNLKNTIP